MSILFSNEIIEAVRNELSNAISSVRIITAYCKVHTFKQLEEFISKEIDDKKLLVRFRLDDVIKGSTDFDLLSYAINKGWKVYIRFDLHAKTYIVDNMRCIVGSANATNSGFSIGKTGNMEMATLVDIEDKDIEKINLLFHDAIYVDENLLDKMTEQYNSIDIKTAQEHLKWNDAITKLFKPVIKTLFSYELPDDFSMQNGEYFSFLDYTYNGNTDSLKDAFRWSNAYLWLKNTLSENDGCMYFGALSEALHNALVTDPKPYRKEVKRMLANLLSLIVGLNMDEIEVDRPNYSQRIILK